MILMRELRCAPFSGASARPLNNWAGPVLPEAVAATAVLRLLVAGQPDPATGFLCDIRILDQILRRTVLGRFPPPQLMSPQFAVQAAFALASCDDLDAELPDHAAAVKVELRLGQHLTLSRTMKQTPKRIELTRTFEFSAAHRLWCEDLSPEENLRVFGKCSNADGHGHNYVLEVIVAGTPDAALGTLLNPPELDRIVADRVIKDFDHRNLNTECPEFRDLNPSVENIAAVVYDRLAGAFDPGVLARVRVWETPKTYAEVEGPEPA